MVEFRKELEIAPLDVPFYVEIGEIRFRAQNLDEAEKSFSQALELQPDYVRAKIGLTSGSASGI